MKLTLLTIGFRLFFLGAAIFGFLSVLLWTGIYSFGLPIQPHQMSPTTWHAHEMIFGYSMAVVAGFLLTAVRKWTDRHTISGIPLLSLFLIWTIARILFFTESLPILYTILFDNIFIIGLTLAIFFPILKVKQWRNMGFVAKLLFILGSNIVFYLGVLGVLPNGIRIGLYSGLYLIVAFIITIGRRIIPFFTERGVGYAVTLTNRKWIDASSLTFFCLFWVSDLWRPNAMITTGLALILSIIYAIRLWGWYTPGIWKKPLLWVLHITYAFIVVAFLLKAGANWVGISPNLATHAFAYGTIGIGTIGMMARVSLGHTGRNIHTPPKTVFWIFSTIVLGAFARTIFPLLFPAHYLAWIVLSQLLWLVAFGLFLLTYTPILCFSRPDGKTD